MKPLICLLIILLYPSALSLPFVHVDEANPGVTGMKFVGLGDWGCKSNQQSKVLSRLNTWLDSNSVMHISLLGDNFYPNGLMNKDDELIDEFFVRPFSKNKNLKDIVYYVISGNHDWRDNMTAQLDQYFNTDFEWRYPTLYYSTATIFNDQTLGQQTVSFVNFDTYMYEESGYYPVSHREIQLDYVNRALAAAAKLSDYIIVQMHHPLYSSGKHGSSDRLSRLFRDMFLKYGVDVVLAAHDHSLEMVYDPNAQGSSSTEKLQDVEVPIYVISGAGCKLAAMSNRVSNSGIELINNQGGFAVFELDNGKMNINFVLSDGSSVPAAGPIVRAKRSDRNCIKYFGFVNKMNTSPCADYTASAADLKANLVPGDDITLEYRYNWLLRWLSWLTDPNNIDDGIVLLLIPLTIAILTVIGILYCVDNRRAKKLLVNTNLNSNSSDTFALSEVPNNSSTGASIPNVKKRNLDNQATDEEILGLTANSMSPARAHQQSHE